MLHNQQNLDIQGIKTKHLPKHLPPQESDLAAEVVHKWIERKKKKRHLVRKVQTENSPRCGGIAKP